MSFRVGMVKRRDLPMLKYRLKYLRETFANTRVIHVTTSRIERFKEEMVNEGKAPATINRFLAIIRRGFRLAQKQRLLSTIPAVEMLREDNVREGFLEPHELEGIVSHLPVELQDLSRFAFLSAWRRREVTRLRWKDVDLPNRTVTLPASLSKNNKSRALPLEGTLFDLMKRREAVRAVHLSSGEIRISEFVFDRGGKEILDFRAAWDAACTAGGKPGTIFHDLAGAGSETWSAAEPRSALRWGFRGTCPGDLRPLQHHGRGGQEGGYS